MLPEKYLQKSVRFRTLCAVQNGFGIGWERGVKFFLQAVKTSAVLGRKLYFGKRNNEFTEFENIVMTISTNVDVFFLSLSVRKNIKDPYEEKSYPY
jgi:hypothetical protein